MRSIGAALAAHHNAYIKYELIKQTEPDTSSYTEVRWLDDQRFVVIYYRIPHGWNAIPTDSIETNSVWVIHGSVE